MRDEVCLVSMPFAAIERPSIALGTLQAILERGGIRTRSEYANIGFAERVGALRFSFWESALGDLLFSRAAFPGFDHPLLERRLRAIANRKRNHALQVGIDLSEQAFVERVMTMREEAVEFIDELARAILERAPRIVGCTSMYWQQTASLALLRRIKALDPSVVTMLGGANCEGVMGLAAHRNFPWIDFVVSGEADDFIVSFVRDVLDCGAEVPRARLPWGVFGPAHRSGGYPTGPIPRPACKNLAAVPAPRYDDYFETLSASPIAAEVRPGLLVETARGCWYGQRNQCKFCGISEVGLKYHSKPSDQVIEELELLARRHAMVDFEITDNILDMAYFKTVLPRLEGRGWRIFWETKANLKREQMAQLARAGIRWVQPGIESLDTRVLRLMDKGVEGSQNLQFLKWARELGLRISWNLLFGFPGEEDGWYDEVAEWLPLVEHLQPPRIMIRLRFDRWSVYQANPDEYGLDLRPDPAMMFAYDVPKEELADLTYYFIDPSRLGPKKGPGVARVQARIQEWQARFWRALPPLLSVEDDGETLHFVDTRACAASTTFKATGLTRLVYLATDERHRPDKLAGLIARDFGGTASPAEVAEALDVLRRQRLVLELDGKVLSLALRGQVPAIPEASRFPGGFVRTDGKAPDLAERGAPVC
jgi:ribosomal peptide maturation radical SAM protein 1